MSDYRKEVNAWKQRNQELAARNLKLLWLMGASFAAWLVMFVVVVF